MAPQYKLTYFNVKGVGEPIRYIFAWNDVQFDDDRIEVDSWSKYKSAQPFETVPVLKYGDISFTQSLAIARYLGHKFGLPGKDFEQNCQLDAAVDHMQECHYKLYALMKEKVSFSEFEKETLPFYLDRFEEFAKDGWFFGNKMTWVDLYFAGWLDTMETRLKGNVLQKYPKLAEINKKVHEKESLQKYLKSRPFNIQ